MILYSYCVYGTDVRGKLFMIASPSRIPRNRLPQQRRVREEMIRFRQRGLVMREMIRMNRLVRVRPVGTLRKQEVWKVRVRTTTTRGRRRMRRQKETLWISREEVM